MNGLQLMVKVMARQSKAARPRRMYPRNFKKRFMYDLRCTPATKPGARVELKSLI
jgi:hypothetical protein